MIDLDSLAMLGSARGGSRRAKGIGFTVMRPLGEEDLPTLLNRPAVGSMTPHITKIRETHHHLARLLSEGRKDVEVCAITGYSQSRISILKHDPSFVELLAYYSGQQAKAHQNVHERLARVGTVALEVIEERLLDAPESFSHRDLLAVTETTLDRSVAPPKTRAEPAPAGQGPAVQIQVNFVPHSPPGEVAERPMIEINPREAGSGGSGETE